MFLWRHAKPVARPVLQEWQYFLGGVTWYKTRELISYLSYNNQMDDECAGKELSF